MSRFKGIYWRTFTVTVGMVALTLVLLGASFFALTYSYIMSEKRGELEDKAEVIAQMAVGVYNKRDVFHLISGMRSDIEELVDVAKRMSDTEFLVWRRPPVSAAPSCPEPMTNFMTNRDKNSRLSGQSQIEKTGIQKAANP